MHDGNSDALVAVSLEVQDHLADFVVRGRHPHSAGAIEVLKDLQGAKEDRYALTATATTAAHGEGHARGRELVLLEEGLVERRP